MKKMYVIRRFDLYEISEEIVAVCSKEKIETAIAIDYSNSTNCIIENTYVEFYGEDNKYAKCTGTLDLEGLNYAITEANAYL